MADPVFKPTERALAARLDLLEPPALSGDFAARLMAAAQALPQDAPMPGLPPIRAPRGPVGRWHAIGRRARLGIAAGGLALAGLGSVSAAAAGYLGEPVNHAVHKLPVVGKLIEKVIPEKRHHHHDLSAHEAGLRRAPVHHAAGLRAEPRPAAADAPPLVAAPQPVIVAPGAGLGMRPRPPWVYPGPLPRTFPPGPERQAAIASFRAFRASHPLPPEVIARRQRRAAMRAERRAFEGGQGAALSRRFAPAPMPDPFATAVPPGAMPPRPERFAPPPGAGPRFGDGLDPAERQQIRMERRRARIEARRMGLAPFHPGGWPGRGFAGPGMAPHPPRFPGGHFPGGHVPGGHWPGGHWRQGPGPLPHPHPPGGWGGGRHFRG